MRRSVVFASLMGASAILMADEPGYQLSVESTTQNNVLAVMPRISAPAGKALRYELVASKEGTSGKTSTRQSGKVAVDAGGSAALSRLSLGVSPQDKYEISVKVFEGDRLVASQVLRYPQ